MAEIPSRMLAAAGWPRGHAQVGRSPIPYGRPLWILVLVVHVSLLGTPVALAGDGGAVVELSNQLVFEPREVTVRVGQAVTWRNSSFLVHTVTADPKLAARKGSASLPAGAEPFNSGNLMPGNTFSHRFSVPGRYGYFCIPHEGAGMTGTIIVTE